MRKWIWAALVAAPLAAAGGFGLAYANSQAQTYTCPLSGEQLPCEKCCPLNGGKQQAQDTAAALSRDAALSSARLGLLDGAGEQQEQAALVRDIFGNPFRTVSADPAWRAPSVVQLAQLIYDERAFGPARVSGWQQHGLRGLAGSGVGDDGSCFTPSEQ